MPQGLLLLPRMSPACSAVVVVAAGAAAAVAGWLVGVVVVTFNIYDYYYCIYIYIQVYVPVISHHRPCSIFLSLRLFFCGQTLAAAVVVFISCRHLAFHAVESRDDVIPIQWSRIIFGDCKVPGLVNVYKKLWKDQKIHHFSWENSLFQWPCSIAMLNYQRVLQFACFSMFLLKLW